MVRGLHGNRHVRYRHVDSFFCALSGFVGEDLHAIAFIRHEPPVAVVRDVPAQTLPTIKEAKICPRGP